MNILEIDKLNCQYGDQPILCELSFSLEQQDILCLLGASGCGKTTLLKAIAGLLPIQQGKILLAGKDLSLVATEKRQIGLIFQDYALFPHLTVAQNIAFGVSHLTAQAREKIIQKMTALVRLDGLLQRYPHQLSGGQQQRVAIARALACQPRLLLLDEPFSNIDSQVRQQMMAEIKQILKQQNIPAIFVTHSKEEAFAFADKIAIMQQGSIVQLDFAQQLYQKPINAFVAEFLGHVNYLPVKYLSPFKIQSLFGVHHNPQGFYYTNNQPIRPQQPLYWLLRPQHIQITPSSQGRGRIIAKQFAGFYFLYQIRLEQYQFEVWHNQSFELGQSVELAYLLEDFCLLAAK